MAQALTESVNRGEQLKRDGIVIRTYDLWKTYIMGDQEINAVSGCDIEIKRGEYVAIMGPSGSGKSTLMNLIGCLDTPSRGEYYINGRLVSDMTDDELARIRNKEIGFVGFATRKSDSYFRRSICWLAPHRCIMWSCR